MCSKDITDKVAKESSDSTASSHKMHDEDHSGVTSGGNVAAAAHKANLVCFCGVEDVVVWLICGRVLLWLIICLRLRVRRS
ncbi:hypothetical protein GQ44DRAFT_712894 [Phaeosphaeriaceae sp. PMI808]|nr:hypothetical protein GQ44DRAFT_712894 [Phaeosphaeriaceae sp. PMI808]